MKAYNFLFVFILTFLVAISCVSAVTTTKEDILLALENALSDGKVSDTEKTNLLDLLENYLSGGTEVPSTKLPDLIVQSITATPENPFADESQAFHVTIKNIGAKETVLNSLKISFYIDNVLFSEAKTSGTFLLRINENYTFNIDRDLDRELLTWLPENIGVHKAVAQVDSDKKVLEENEANNFLEKSFEVVSDDSLVLLGDFSSKGLFPVAAWGDEGWTDCNYQDAGFTGADKICKYKGFSGAIPARIKPCYLSTVQGYVYSLKFDANGVPVKGSASTSVEGTSMAFTNVKCRAK